MSLPEPTDAIRPHEYDKFHVLFERAYPRPKSRAQVSNWKFKREMAWRGWLWARQTPYVAPKNTLTTAFFTPLTPDMIAGMK
jgi:hypothetical protein